MILCIFSSLSRLGEGVGGRDHKGHGVGFSTQKKIYLTYQVAFFF
jgi:hypothetical protein